ncbi:MAG TPA: biotin--[acetyl-CoA-carboxylase] ligase [Candidatus Parabacteroides intestinavium]|nr:biotin--[acetyl-CoA-carboxylase] ligase [Candidatus Parabacteroides intestinavium]
MKHENEEIMPQIIYLQEIDSTNNYLHALAHPEQLGEGSVVWAEFQTAGRGQIGNSWESAEGENLTFSVVLYPTFLPANRQFLISQITALSVKQTLDRYVDDITVKWPNDIYWRDRKICGMLIENDLTGQFIYSSILGIGININQKEFKSNAPNPVSLYQILGKETDREAFLHEFLEQLYANYLLLLQEKDALIQNTYRQALFRREGFYLYEDANGCFEAAIEEIEPSGYLHLRLKDNTVRRYEFKEVKFVISS